MEKRKRGSLWRKSTLRRFDFSLQLQRCYNNGMIIFFPYNSAQKSIYKSIILQLSNFCQKLPPYRFLPFFFVVYLFTAKMGSPLSNRTLSIPMWFCLVLISFTVQPSKHHSIRNGLLDRKKKRRDKDREKKRKSTSKCVQLV